MLQCQRWRWYDKVLPNSAPIFPKLDFLPFPQLYAVPGHQELKALTLRWHHNLTSVFANNKPTEPLHSLSFPQSSLDLLPVAHRCLLDWMSWFSSSGTQTPKGWQLQLRKSLRKGSLQWTCEAWFCTSRVCVEVLTPIYLLHHPIFSSIHLTWLYSQLQSVHSLRGKPE